MKETQGRRKEERKAGEDSTSRRAGRKRRQRRGGSAARARRIASASTTTGTTPSAETDSESLGGAGQRGGDSSTQCAQEGAPIPSVQAKTEQAAHTKESESPGEEEKAKTVEAWGLERKEKAWVVVVMREWRMGEVGCRLYKCNIISCRCRCVCVCFCFCLCERETERGVYACASMAPAAPPGKPRCWVSEGAALAGSGVSPAAGGEKF